ncbi:HAD family hydrolase [Thermococcus sp. MV5]|uniref:HAD family hydrolase n=1 Tax=Thermococcus sp. MV5 TaxID=1638272 RepID=UPI00143B4087|nr:HAD family hydrolase [Thermococcus sp. MV5]NJE26116.1 HAD family hydrolase [Thermococcus sp. MV5]
MKEIALIWDFDGVLVFTPHEEAWKRAARHYGADIDHEFYVTYVSGKPRYEGAHKILELKGIYERYNARSEEERKDLLHEFAEFKNRIVNEMFEREEYEVNWNAIAFLQNTKEAGIKNALASASKNATKLAKKVKIGEKTLADLFDVNVSGMAPTKKEVFKLAMEELRRSFSDIKFFFVIEDAPAGIQAGKELGALTLGYEREARLDSADLTFDDFAKLATKNLQQLIEKKEGRV